MVLMDLKNAAMAGKIETMETFGKKSQEDILEALTIFENAKQRVERMPMPYAAALAAEIEEHLRKVPGITRVDFLGSLRRKVATIGDIDVAVATAIKNFPKVIDHFVSFKRAISINTKGENKAAIIISPNIRVDLRVQDNKSYGSMLQYFTGGKTHNIKLREYALKKGLSLSEWGIKDTKTGKLKEFETEEKFYDYVGVPWMPPEIREGTNEIQMALKKEIPPLVEVKDLKGDLHIHSSYDLSPSHDMGANTYEEIAKKAIERKYEYVGFADHNPRTSNNTEQDIVEIMRKRKEHIDKVLKNSKIPYFIGLEVDIYPSGELALPEKAIEYVDYLIVSVHSSFRQPKEEATQRILKAFSYPKVKIFGHPTGRLLGKRDGLEYDWDRVFDYVKKHNIAIEVNSGPERLDLPDTLVREAVSNGVKLVIDTDAHHVDWMDGVEYGVSVARRGWATKSDILNTLGYKSFKNWLISS
jgi:DNA polymerase (family 10)